jgi:ubiquinone/menaquinone biosynthesis C-methylase UbiE
MKLAEVYNRNAGYWDSMLYRAVYHGAYIRLLRTILSESTFPVPGRVLDCGIGAGLFSEALLHVAGRRIELNGVDLSSRLLAMSATKFSRLGANARLAFGDILRLPYRNGQMDLVISALVLEHVRHPLDAVREMVRVLRHGGPLVIIATRRGAPDYYFRSKYGYKPYPAAEILDWLNAAGLVDVRSRTLPGIARFFAQACTGTKMADQGHVARGYLDRASR